MKQSFYLLLGAVVFFSCQSTHTAPETDIETAGAFMKNIWQMDFDKAATFLIKDETNKQVFSRFEQYMKARPKDELAKYRNADFIINDTKEPNDSVHIINCSGSFNKEEKTDLKLVRTNGKWLIDLKYTIPQTDTTQKQ